jgi:hypothetical protein
MRPFIRARREEEAPEAAGEGQKLKKQGAADESTHGLSTVGVRTVQRRRESESLPCVEETREMSGSACLAGAKSGPAAIGVAQASGIALSWEPYSAELEGPGALASSKLPGASGPGPRERPAWPASN